jgi:hypothetical protein
MKNNERKIDFSGVALVDRPTSYVLEQRIMLDAAAIATGAEAVADAKAIQVAEAVVDSHDNGVVADASEHAVVALVDAMNAKPGKTVLVVDAGVESVAELVAGVSGDVEVIRVDAQSGGLAQVADALAGRDDVSSLHIVSHGDAGVLNLGEGMINFASLTAAQQDSLNSIKGALTDSADILVYGCNFGAGLRGQNAVDTLAGLTGADVAASDGITGSINRGADWDFEVAHGTIESGVVFDAATQMGYGATLAAPNTATDFENEGSSTASGVGYVGSGGVNSGWAGNPDSSGHHYFAAGEAFSIQFNLIDASDANGDEGEVIVGFSSSSSTEVQPGATDSTGLGTTGVDFGVYMDDGMIYAFVNGNINNLIYIGQVNDGGTGTDANLMEIAVAADGTITWDYNSALDGVLSFVSNDDSTGFGYTANVTAGTGYVFDSAIDDVGSGYTNLTYNGEHDYSITVDWNGEDSISDEIFESDLTNVTFQDDGYINSGGGGNWTDAAPDTGVNLGEGNSGVNFVGGTEYSTIFNFVGVDDETSQTIVGFTPVADNQAAPVWNDAAGVFDVEFGFYVDAQVVYAFVNYGAGDWILMGNLDFDASGDIDAHDALIEVAADGSITFTYDGQVAVADATGDKSWTYTTTTAGNHVLDTAIYAQNAGYANMLITNDGRLISGGRFVLHGTVGGAKVQDITIVDLDTTVDGLDILVGTGTGFYAYVNNGDETFNVVTIDTSITKIFSVTGRDTDGDGDVDIVAAADNVSGEVYSYVYTPAADGSYGGFAAATVQQAAGTVPLTRPNGLGVDSAGNIIGADWSQGVVYDYGSDTTQWDGGDASDGGIVELITPGQVEGGSSANDWVALDNPGNVIINGVNIGNFGEGYAYDIEAGDLDGDGGLELVAVDQYGNIGVFDNGALAFTIDATTFDTPLAVLRGVGIGDADGDGDQDIIVADYLGNYTWLMNNSSAAMTAGKFAVSTTTQYNESGVVMANLKDVDAADIDGDGDADAIFADKTGVYWVESVFTANHHETSIDGAEANLGDDLASAVIGDDTAEGAYTTNATPEFSLTSAGVVDGPNEVLVLGVSNIALSGSATGTSALSTGTTVAWSATGGVVTFTNNAGGVLTTDDINALLQDIRYRNNAGVGSTEGHRTFTTGGATSTIDVILS